MTARRGEQSELGGSSDTEERGLCGRRGFRAFLSSQTEERIQKLDKLFLCYTLDLKDIQTALLLGVVLLNSS